MAKKKMRAKGGAKGAAPKQKSGRSDAGPLKGMAIGAVIAALVAAFFMLRLGGATPFDHLRKALGGGDEETPAAAPQTPAKPPASKPSTTANPPPPKAAPIAIQPGANQAPPMEEVSGDEQRDLQKLIEQRTK